MSNYSKTEQMQLVEYHLHEGRITLDQYNKAYNRIIAGIEYKLADYQLPTSDLGGS